MIKKYLRILNLAVICCFLCVTTASARVCFLPDSKDCGQGDTNMPETNSTVIPCDHKDCNDTSWYNKTYEDCYTSGVCAYKRCQLTQKKCEKTRQKDEECKLDVGTGCYYTQKIDKCSPLYNRTQNDIHGDCKECVDKQGSHWYCQYDTCNNLYSGSSSNPTCQDGTTKKKIGISINEGACYICSTDPNAETCDTYQDEEKIGIDRGCWECDQCPSDRSKFRCRQKIREGYEIKNGVCQISSRAKTCKQLGEEKNEHWKGDRKDLNCLNPAKIKDVFGSDGQCYKCGTTDSTCETGTATVYVAEYYYYRLDENVCGGQGLRFYGQQYILTSGSSEQHTLPAEVNITGGNIWTLSTYRPIEKKDCSQKIISLSDYTKIFGTENSEFGNNGYRQIKSTKTKCFEYAGASKDEYITDDIKQSQSISCAGTYVVVGGCKELKDDNL